MATPEITHVFFDAGNTLLHLDFEFIRKALGDLHVDVTVKDLRAAEGQARSVVDQAVRSGTPRGDQERARDYFGALFRAAGVSEHLFPALEERLLEHDRTLGLWSQVPDGTPQVLASLREKGKRLGVISNSDGRLRQRLAQHGLLSCFDSVIDSSLVGVEKPDRRIFELALEETGARPDRSLYVGDIYTLDVEPATQLGFRAVLLDGAGTYPHPPCTVVRRLRELLSLVG